MHSRKGFTLIEVLIVVAILAILVIATLLSFASQRRKAEDARVKSDLSQLKIAFENYYNDETCYPPITLFDDANDCGSNGLSPYLSNIPCNKSTGQPYHVEKDPTGCKWFKLYAPLENSSDPDAFTTPVSLGSELYNYGVSSSNVDAQVLTQLPSGHNYYWCSGVGNCTSFDSTQFICTPYYTDNANCDGGPTPCQTIGSCTPL